MSHHELASSPFENCTKSPVKLFVLGVLKMNSKDKSGGYFLLAQTENEAILGLVAILSRFDGVGFL